jgi:hypothetical protein
MNMKKYTIIIESKKTDKELKRTYNISDETFYLISGPLQEWGEEVDEFDDDLIENIRNSFFDISDVVVSGLIKQKLDLDQKEWSTIDIDIEPSRGEVIHWIKLK